MKVRGAPAIGLVAALSLAIELQIKSLEFSNNKNHKDSEPLNIISSPTALGEFIRKSLDYLNTSRPTAVNLFLSSKKLWEVTCDGLEENLSSKEIIEKIVDFVVKMLEDDLKDNKNIGKFGGEFLFSKVDNEMISVVTHCNTGSLATSGYGTALGIIRYLHEQGRLSRVYFTETRPYNQGSRLTSYELLHDQIPSTLICDSMVSALLSSSSLPHINHTIDQSRTSSTTYNKISAIIVGADRIAKNGDTANKIGTYQLAITAKYHGIMFIVAAPSTSIDLNTESGKEIIIEERSEDELVLVNGAIINENDNIIMEKVRVPPKGVKAWNPSFDITPAELITAIISEKGVFEKKLGMKEFDLTIFK
ncbi:hypothetical protein Glove_613g6 [Diversispora epigaea]|uniref:S-methyl-5-thioribose-1-phosphate isomerase n=1 Tax=Diversispora epigaea TaxID=1348612 RepID=A0A397G6C8_9GLOM|nr:hypothetical protein Glove_613g6 [Diversispora epigaea]